jgi:hypothetical protein
MSALADFVKTILGCQDAAAHARIQAGYESDTDTDDNITLKDAATQTAATIIPAQQLRRRPSLHVNFTPNLPMPVASTAVGQTQRLHSPPATPIKPRRGRGRPSSRTTSSKRSPKATVTPRKPLTPTTVAAIKKERRHRAYLRKRAKEEKRDALLREVGTYWMVLKSGRRLRRLGGTRRR